MPLTKVQEDYLAVLADAGLAEQAETVSRNDQIALDAAVNTAREAKLAELKAEAKALVDAGIKDFEDNVVPTIKPEK